MNDLSTTYNPKEVEDKIYAFWQKGGYFNPDTKIKNLLSSRTRVEGKLKIKNYYSIAIPPPNVTGSLHMGHALNNTLQDILIRRARMQGKSTLWIPGTDHAGIATQNVVEKKLRKEGKSRHDLGREKFVEQVWDWKQEYGGKIIDQLKKLGCSCDWSRERFTMDDDYSKAIEHAFMHYYNKGWIYQGTRVINWCTRCWTSISDLEVDHVEEKAKLYYFKYDKKFPITIATTRPETKLGDTAVAVHPSDKRYKKYIGKIFEVGFAGIKRNIKIISDKDIDPKFGTGALGVTPAHSLIDAEIAEKNILPIIQVIDQKGQMTKEAGENFVGLKVLEARQIVIAWLNKEKLLEKTEDITHNLSICDRCKRPLEPQPSEQWFLSMKELAKPAIEAIKKDKVKFYPIRWKKVTLDWLENIHDWCISRQLWWGHRLPVWQPELKTNNEKLKTTDIYVGDKPPKGWIQSEDVLDTWFSSALWPFATLGWPRACAETNNSKLKTKNYCITKNDTDLAKFFPTTTLSTARDIVYLWVARMIFSSLEFMGEVPFKEVYIHPTVFNKEGKRMSKSLGTGVDPLELIEKYGTDATRFGLAFQDTGTQDMKFSDEHILAAKKFANKMWNASRFVIQNTQIDTNNDTNKQRINSHPEVNPKDLDSSAKSPQNDIKPETSEDEAILSKLNSVIKSTDENLDKFRFGQAAHELYDFFWHDFCDKYLEESKMQLEDAKLKQNTQHILLYTLVINLKLLHPFMPFITEEIYQNLLHVTHSIDSGQACYRLHEKSIMISDWPSQN
ncbi:MAG: valyl-tRNA synthetase [uncultured bacterium]|nr:MAG: valyl-tRNA synthetase [uncultured bacterium]